MMTLADLKPGEKALITGFSTPEFSLHLMEMGCTPGEAIAMERYAPLGDPIAVSIDGYFLSLRKNEATTILVKKME
jgi:ferrous iron transport protein A